MRLTWNATLGLAFAIVLVLGMAGVASAQNPPAQQAPAQQQGAAPGVVFTGDSAIVLHYIKADKTADFEAAMAKVKEGLLKSQSPERKQQAASWKIFKAAEPAGEGQVLYLFIIDPVVKGANYSVSAILAEAFPADAAAIFKSYADAYSKGQVRMNLNLVLNMAQ